MSSVLPIVMRAALALLLLTCTAAPSSTSGGSVEMRTISRGAYAAATPDAPQATAAKEDAEYRRLWTSLIGSGDPPAVDFASESVVFLLAGQRRTGGWSVDPRSAAVDGDALIVEAAIQGPRPDEMVTQALTSPYAVVAVKTKAYTDVRWKR